MCEKETEILFKDQTCCLSCHNKFQNKIRMKNGTHNMIKKESCPKCGKEFNVRGLKRHLLFNDCDYLNCKQCGKKLTSKKNKFCNKSCATTYNNTHKKYGCRRSRFEEFVERKLTLDFPELEIYYNYKEIINYELDIYIPQLKIAIELNGPIHYINMYGVDLLERTQKRDLHKILLCYEIGIELITIDTTAASGKKQEEFYNIIKDIILNNAQKLLLDNKTK